MSVQDFIHVSFLSNVVLKIPFFGLLNAKKGYMVRQILFMSFPFSCFDVLQIPFLGLLHAKKRYKVG